MSGPIELIVRDRVARLALNRPTSGNSIDVGMADALMEASVAVAEDPCIDLVVLTGMGRMFCAGGDLDAIAAQPERAGEVIARITVSLHAAILRLARMDKALVTLVNGPAAGAGLGLALLGDIVIAARSAHFTSAYTLIGMSPDAGTSWLLPRLVGLRRAQEMILTNRRIEADEALAWGMVSKVVENDDSGSALDEVIAQLRRAPAGASGASRRLLLQATEHSLAAQLEAEAAAITLRGRSAEGQTAITKFQENARKARQKPVLSEPETKIPLSYT